MAACFVFDGLTLDVVGVKWNGFFEIVQHVLVRAS